MLLGYGAKNCWCFKNWIDINLRLNGYVPEEISLGKDYSLVLGFEGANASGKTSALKIFAFIIDFAKNSFSYSPEARILFDPYFDDVSPSEFYTEFKKADGVEYRYEAIFHTDNVVKESLLLIKGIAEETIFERNFDSITTNNLYDNTAKIILRKNASL